MPAVSVNNFLRASRTAQSVRRCPPPPTCRGPSQQVPCKPLCTMSHAGHAQVPASWQQQAPAGFPKDRLPAFVAAVEAACSLHASWPANMQPASVPLALLYSPDKFLLGLQQAYARAGGLALEAVELAIQVQTCKCKNSVRPDPACRLPARGHAQHQSAAMPSMYLHSVRCLG